jgi:hypothetical protein
MWTLQHSSTFLYMYLPHKWCPTLANFVGIHLFFWTVKLLSTRAALDWLILGSLNWIFHVCEQLRVRQGKSQEWDGKTAPQLLFLRKKKIYNTEKQFPSHRKFIRPSHCDLQSRLIDTCSKSTKNIVRICGRIAKSSKRKFTTVNKYNSFFVCTLFVTRYIMTKCINLLMFTI